MPKLNNNKLLTQRNFKSIWHSHPNYIAQYLKEDQLIREYIIGSMKAKEWNISEIIIKRKVKHIHIAFQIQKKKLKERKRWTKNKLRNRMQYENKMKLKRRGPNKRKKIKKKIHLKKRQLFFQIFLMIAELRKIFSNNLITFYVQKTKPLQYNSNLVNSWIVSNLKKKKSYKRLINKIIWKFQKGVQKTKPSFNTIDKTWNVLKPNDRKNFISWITANLIHIFKVKNSFSNLNSSLIKTLNYKVKTKEPSWNFFFKRRSKQSKYNKKINCKYINEKEDLYRYKPKGNLYQDIYKKGFFIKSSPRKNLLKKFKPNNNLLNKLNYNKNVNVYNFINLLKSNKINNKFQKKEYHSKSKKNNKIVYYNSILSKLNKKKFFKYLWNNSKYISSNRQKLIIRYYKKSQKIIKRAGVPQKSMLSKIYTKKIIKLPTTGPQVSTVPQVPMVGTCGTAGAHFTGTDLYGSRDKNKNKNLSSNNNILNFSIFKPRFIKNKSINIKRPKLIMKNIKLKKKMNMIAFKPLKNYNINLNKRSKELNKNELIDKGLFNKKNKLKKSNLIIKAILNSKLIKINNKPQKLANIFSDNLKVPITDIGKIDILNENLKQENKILNIQRDIMINKLLLKKFNKNKLKYKLKNELIIKYKYLTWLKRHLNKKNHLINSLQNQTKITIKKDLRSVWKLNTKNLKELKFYKKKFKEENKFILNYYKLKYFSLKILKYYNKEDKFLKNTINFLWQGKFFIKFLKEHPVLLDHIINCLISLPKLIKIYSSKEDQLIVFLTNIWIGIFDYLYHIQRTIHKYRGIKIILAGRIGWRKMGRAKKYTKSWGTYLNSSASSPLQYTYSQIYTRYGVIGMKIFMR